MKKKTRLKIAQVNHMDLSGGAAKIALNLHHQIRGRGHGSWMVVGEKESLDPSIFQIPDKVDFFWSPLFEAAAIRTAKIKTPFAKKTLGHYFTKLRDPRRLICDELGFEDFYYPASRKILNFLPEAPDIVHLHNLHHKYFDLNYLPELSHTVPTMITLHDAWLLSGHCAHSLFCEKWKTGCGNCPNLDLFPPVKRDVTHFNWKHKKKIFSSSMLYIASPSRWLLEKAEQSILKPGMVEGRVIHNGIDQIIFNSMDRKGARRRLGISEQVVTLLFLAVQGAKNAYKDFDTILKAIELIKNSALDKEILMLVVGGDKEIESPGEEYAGNVRIRSIPYLHDPIAVADYYRAADIYLQASLADTFPNVVIEALSCGTPVVATRVGGIPEQIVDGKTGYLVNPGDWKAMAELTIKLIRDEQLRDSMGKNAQEDAQKRFKLEDMVNQYIDWYYEILDKTTSQAGSHV